MNAFIRSSEMDGPTERFLISLGDPFETVTVQECVREPNQRLIDLLCKPGRLTALEWREVELLAGDEA